jgi:hypothetical protein
LETACKVTVCCNHQKNQAGFDFGKMSENKKSLKRKTAEAGGWFIAKRVAKSVPYLGAVMAIGLVGYDIKRKGLVKGIINSGLDAIPFVGFGKNAIEFFTGDLIPDKKVDELKLPKKTDSDDKEQ